MAKKIELTKGKFAIVDDDDYEFLSSSSWQTLQSKRKNGDVFYAYRTERLDKSVPYRERKNSAVMMHRVVMKAAAGIEVDHIDGDGLNNQKSNLRTCTSGQNKWNQRIQPFNKSGFKGVYWNKEKRCWSTQIGINNKRQHVGHFEDKVEAAKAYDKKAVELFGEFARLNFNA